VSDAPGGSPEGAPARATVRAADGASIAVHLLGGSGPPLVLAHATGFHGLVWRALANRLATAFACVAHDSRGHGDSPQAGGALRWSDFASDVLGVVDGLALTRPVGFGHSSGATALLLAEQARPGTLAALVCFEPVVVVAEPPLGRDPDSWLAERARRRRDRFSSRAEALAHYAARPPLAGLDPEVLRDYVEYGLADAGDGTLTLKCVADYEAAIYETATEHDCFVRLGDVRCPVTLVRGERSSAYPPGQFEALAARLPDGSCEVLHGLSHFRPLEDPSAIADCNRRALAGD
jgi:pimeloyl-ACP methyl ester carboxylesterase